MLMNIRISCPLGMSVSIWLVLGVILVLFALPLWYVAETSGSFAFGAGIAFLIVALSRWVWEASGTGHGPTETESPS
jgi:presenilin-like A22 family membrane protease